jgi:GntR family carbon starvation induced transcriptional regulator
MSSAADPVPTARTLAEQVYAALKGDILSGFLPAGSPLLTKDLLDRYKCGVSPLREALARLVGEQFLEASSHRGVRVPLPSANDVDDVYRIRIALEREALALALVHGDDTWEAEIVAAAHRLERSPLPDIAKDRLLAISEWEKRHRTFHTSLISAAPAPRLLRLIDQMVDQTERYRIIRLTASDYVALERDILAEHRKLMELVVARSIESLSLIAEHLDQTRRAVLSRIQQ